MALGKSIELSNGVVVNYHRITSLNIITNIHNVVEISSYTSEKKRQEELKARENEESTNIYIYTTIMSVPYDQEATIESTYEYLKTLPIFDGSEDV